MFDRKIVLLVLVLVVILFGTAYAVGGATNLLGTVGVVSETSSPATAVPEQTPIPPTQTVDEGEWNPEISVFPLSATAGTEIQIKGQGFPPDHDLVVGMGRVNSEYDVIDQVHSKADGSLDTMVTVPDFVDPETQWVIVVATADSRVKAISQRLEIEAKWGVSLRVSPLSAAVGEGVTITGEGFPASSTVQLGIGRVDSEYDLVDTAETDSEGSFETQMTIPDFVDPEDQWVIVATANEGKIKAISEVVEITSQESASIRVSPLSAAVGEGVTITGEGFPASSTVQLGIGRVDSEYDLVDTAETDSEGSFETQMTIPDFVDPEDQWVIVATANEGRIKAFSEILDIPE
ncbi:MAG: hypothetical protein R6U57_02915 [Anaerolineales bacterium]